MPVSDTQTFSASTLTRAAYASFVPIGIATVLLGPLLPTLSVRWSLNYSQAGALFTAQYLASTLAVALSGVLVARWGFRFAMNAGLGLMTAGLALLPAGPKWLGIVAIATYGGGMGIAVPAANLLVAEVNPNRRSETLNWLNLCWSLGAVACPFLVASAAKTQKVSLMLVLLCGFSLIMTIGIALMPATAVEPSTKSSSGESVTISWKQHSLLVFGALFFLYVGTENGFGGWVASYAKTLGRSTPALSLMTPSFFYGALTMGRWLAPLLLRVAGEIKLVRAGLLLACSGATGLILSHGLTGLIASACAAGLGLSYVYPITIALLSKRFGSSTSKIGSVMFVLSNLGGAVLPWIVGVSSNRIGTLKAGLFVPLLGCSLMFALYSWARFFSERK